MRKLLSNNKIAVCVIAIIGLAVPGCKQGVVNKLPNPAPDPHGGFALTAGDICLCSQPNPTAATGSYVATVDVRWQKAPTDQFGEGHVRLYTDGPPVGWEKCTISTAEGQCVVKIKLDPPLPGYAEAELQSAAGVSLSGYRKAAPFPSCQTCP